MGILRLLLALAVVGDKGHAGPVFGVPWLCMTNAPLAVQIFYVVSGFYMTLVLNEKYVGRGSYALFAKSRFLRLVPMFLVVLAATVLGGLLLRATVGVAIAPLQQWSQHGSAMPWGDWLLLALANVTIVGQDALSFCAVDSTSHALYFTSNFHVEPLAAWQFLFVPQAWTVALEIVFYALAPLLVRRRPWVLLVLIAASLGLRVFLMEHWQVRNDPWTYRLFPTELALFLAGAIAWHVHGWLQRRGWLTAGTCNVVLVATLALVVGYQWLPKTVIYTRPYGLPLVLGLVPFVLPFVFEATRTTRFDRALGELSYPAYLVHYLLLFVAGAIGGEWLLANQGTVVTVATLVCAWLLWRTVGRPLEERRQRIGRAVSVGRPAGHAS